MTEESSRRKVSIDFEDLKEAFEEEVYDKTFYLDLKTGEVITILESDFEGVDLPPMAAEVESHPHRYITVPPLDPDDLLEDLAAYVQDHSGEDVTERFDAAIEEGLSGRNIPEFFEGHPDLEEGWEAFRNGRLRMRVEDWLASHEVEPVFENAPERLEEDEDEGEGEEEEKETSDEGA